MADTPRYIYGADGRPLHLAQSERTKPDITERGLPGTRILDGLLYEEDNPDLRGAKGLQMFKTMGFDPTVAATLYVRTLPIRATDHHVEPGSDDPLAVEMADFAHYNLWEFGSSQQTFDEVARTNTTDPLKYGFSYGEIAWSEDVDGDFAGKWCWDKIAYRSPFAKYRWNIEEIDTPGAGRVRRLVSITQLAPPNYEFCDIPWDKVLIWTHRKEGENFDGWAMLRDMYLPWRYLDGLRRVQAIGLEKSYIGIPRGRLPEDYSVAEKEAAERILKNLRTREDAYALHSEAMDIDVLFNKLEGPAMQAALDSYMRQIARVGLADGLMLGDKVGAMALAQDKSDLLLMTLNADDNQFCDVFNLEPGIPQLIRYNYGGVPRGQMPRLVHGDIGERDLAAWGRALQALVAGGLLTPDPEIENAVRRALKFPELEELGDRARDALASLIAGPQVDRNLIPGEGKSDAAAEAQESATAKQPGKLAMAEARRYAEAGDLDAAAEVIERNRDAILEYEHEVAPLRAASETLQQALPALTWKPANIHDPGQRRRVMLTEQFLESTERLENRVRHDGRPERPSVRMARLRRPYVLRTDLGEIPVLGKPGELPRQVEARARQAIAMAERKPKVVSMRQIKARQHVEPMKQFFRDLPKRGTTAKKGKA